MRKFTTKNEDVLYMTEKLYPNYKEEDLLYIEHSSRKIRVNNKITEDDNPFDVPDCPFCNGKNVVKRGKSSPKLPK